MSTKPVIVVHPDSATKAVKDVLRRAGYAVVVATNAKHFRTLDVMPVVGMSVIMRAALETIDKAYDSSVREGFGKRVARMLLAIHEAEKALPTDSESDA
jgi:hypothetical protein